MILRRIERELDEAAKLISHTNVDTQSVSKSLRGPCDTQVCTLETELARWEKRTINTMLFSSTNILLGRYLERPPNSGLSLGVIDPLNFGWC